mgnify:CR=1 FL=1
MELVVLYLLLFNVLGLLLMYLDKHFARRHLHRIPESVLMMSAVVGGSIGAWCGMYLFHHKTRKPKFYLGIPTILFIQIALAIWLWRSGIFT